MDIILQSRYAGRHVPMGPAFGQYRRAAEGARHHRRPGSRDAADRALPHRGTLFPLLCCGGTARHDRDRHRHVLRADRARLDRPSQHPWRRRMAGDGDTCRPVGRTAIGCVRIGRMRLRIFTEPQQGASYATLRRVATTAEALGFDAFFRSDHLMKMGPGDGLPGPTDSWATLAGLAAETSRIRLGTLVTAATFRLPGPLAIAVAQVDDMSGGRVELAIGTGLWETPPGEKFSFDGAYYQVADSPALPKPAQRPRPPVIIGGAGRRRTPALAARYADEFNANFVSVADAGAQFARVRDACVAAGRDPE